MSKSYRRAPSGWDPVADWYDGWVGPRGSHHHRKLAIPAVLNLLQLRQGEHVLDIGAGQGVLAQYVADGDAHYTGIDISRKMIGKARQRHHQHGRFLKGDARHLERIAGLRAASFDAAVFLLSIEDMNPLEAVIGSAAWALKAGGRMVILMRHACFRVPRQSGWGDDEGRKLRYRRIDRYLTPLSVPMKAYEHDRSGTTISFHRPLSAYINALATYDLLIDHMDEIVTHNQGHGKAERRANAEIPLFLALRARRLAD